MNKEMRLALIIEIISKYEVKTQKELQKLLVKRGLHVTQATISRDIRTLRLIKIPYKEGGHKYSFKMDPEQYISEKLQHKLRDALVGMEVIQYFVIVKTLPGHAHAFGALLDSIELEGKAGTLCGNDTCLIICRSPKQADNIKQLLDGYRNN